MPTLTVDAHREQMKRELAGGNPYRYLSMATAYIDAYPDDHHTRLLAIREYLKLGLTLPAHELLEVDPSILELPPEFAAVRQSLANIGAKSTPWSQYSGRYEANLSSLTGREIDVAPIRQAWNLKQSSFQLFQDGNGIDQVRMRDQRGKWRWIPFLGDHEAVDKAQPLPADLNTITPAPVLFEGLDLGHLFARVYAATKDTFLGYSCALFVVEPDPAMLALVLHLRDWQELLADRRVFAFFGDTCVRQLCRVWEDDFDLPLPHRAFVLSEFRPGCSPGAVDAVREVSEARERSITDSFCRIEAQYADRDIRYWADRFDEALTGKGEPLRILSAVSTHTTFLQHSMRDAKRAFEQLGHKHMVLTEKTPYGVVGPLTYHRAIRDLDPDVFLILDHLRPELKSLVPANLPILTWDQDQLPHVFTNENMRRVARHDLIAGCSKANFVLSGFNARQYLYARVPTSPEEFGGEPLTDEERERYTCDVSYVSHASQTAREFHHEERATLQDPRLPRLLDTMYELMPAMLNRHRVADGHVIMAIFEEASRACGITVHDEGVKKRLMWWYLWRLGDRMFRHEALEWVAQWARASGRVFRIYGNGWDRHPTLSEFASGPAANGRELLCIYRASRINLQLMPAGFIHQRALDGLAGGGFFLTRLAPQDLRGTTLRKLERRIRDLGITRQRDLLGSSDPTLHQTLHDYVGEWLHRHSPDNEDLLTRILLAAELSYPDEVFSQFAETVFDSPEDFARIADRFLADEEERLAMVENMRQVVIERFSYRPTMHRFLKAMREYLRAECP